MTKTKTKTMEQRHNALCEYFRLHRAAWILWALRSGRHDLASLWAGA